MSAKTNKVLDYIDPTLLESNAVPYKDNITRYFDDAQILTLKARLVERIFQVDSKNRFAAYVKSLMSLYINSAITTYPKLPSMIKMEFYYQRDLCRNTKNKQIFFQ